MNDERYPNEIGNFEAWYTARMDEIKHAKSERDVSSAVEMIRPYADNRWCFPHRLTEAENLASKPLSRLASKRMSGDAA